MNRTVGSFFNAARKNARIVVTLLTVLLVVGSVLWWFQPRPYRGVGLLELARIIPKLEYERELPYAQVVDPEKYRYVGDANEIEAVLDAKFGDRREATYLYRSDVVSRSPAMIRLEIVGPDAAAVSNKFETILSDIKAKYSERIEKILRQYEDEIRVADERLRVVNELIEDASRISARLSDSSSLLIAQIQKDGLSVQYQKLSSYREMLQVSLDAQKRLDFTMLDVSRAERTALYSQLFTGALVVIVGLILFMIFLILGNRQKWGSMVGATTV